MTVEAVFDAYIDAFMERSTTVPTVCPLCKNARRFCSANSGTKPVVGDYSMCSTCLTFVRFDHNLLAVRVDESELPDVDATIRRRLIQTKELLLKVKKERHDRT